MKSEKNQLSKVASKKDMTEKKINVNDHTKVWNVSSKVEIIRELFDAEQNQVAGSMDAELTKLLKNEELVVNESTLNKSKRK